MITVRLYFGNEKECDRITLSKHYHCITNAIEEGKNMDKNYEEVVTGKREPVGSEVGYLYIEKNRLDKIDQERAREIRRKGQAAAHKVVMEKRTARESMHKLLHVVASGVARGRVESDILAEAKKINPNLTLYDIINLVQIDRAMQGSARSAEYVRDTAGDKPTDKVDLTAQSLTDEDRELLRTVQERLERAQNDMRKIDKTDEKPPEQ